MKPGKTTIAICCLLFCLIILLFGISGCSAKCPADGDWSTSQTSGVISFTTASCKIESVVVNFDNGQGSTTTEIFQPNCSSSFGKIVCTQDQMTFSGQFGPNNQAQGTVTISKGLALNTGGTLEKAVKLDWTASLNK
jgi:hypothetical protein